VKTEKVAAKLSEIKWKSKKKKKEKNFVAKRHSTYIIELQLYV
jgi:hypothetical protein